MLSAFCYKWLYLGEFNSISAIWSNIEASKIRFMQVEQSRTSTDIDKESFLPCSSSTYSFNDFGNPRRYNFVFIQSKC